MIQSLLLISESSSDLSAVDILEAAQCAVREVASQEEGLAFIMESDAIIMAVSFLSLTRCCRFFQPHGKPLFWWCGQQDPPQPLDGTEFDGILFPSMDAAQIRWTMNHGQARHTHRKRLMQEREHLLMRLEERKWIEQAKDILRELKNISEEQAHDFLRKQAMDERKKMVDVAKSIVQVYRLIRER
jgi:response regulator NasT